MADAWDDDDEQARVNARRERYLRSQRARMERAALPEHARPRFQCGTCGLVFVGPDLGFILGGVSLTDNSTGQVVELPIERAVASSECPRCGQTAQAVNQYVAEENGRKVTGFADTAAQKRAITATIAELRALDAGASVDQIVETLERQGAHTRPVVEYLRKHHLELAALGVGLLALVIAMLQWLVPRAPDSDRPAVPPGITHEQMEDLISELRSTPSKAPSQPSEPKSDDASGEPV